MKIKEIIDLIYNDFKNNKLHYGHGTDNAEDEAFALVFQYLKLSFDVDESILDRELSEQKINNLRALAKLRIEEHIPVPYLVNEAYFANMPFYVDERVIIPRSPFAELIENQFSPWIEKDNVHNILDLCTGSGCMAIAAAKYFPKAHVDATDLLKEVLTVAKINVEKHNVSDQITLIESNVWEHVPKKKYDIIMSNPPYVSHDEMSSLPQEFLNEPDFALRAEDEGLKIVLEILKYAKEYLTDHGILVVEVGNSKEALEKRMPNVPFIWLEFDRGGEGVFLLTYTT